ncbi:M48 family metallopeptidase [Clostridium sp. D2Q-14]|uniref:M48 family metallopeptidase n=1 Tax=Anaeromonas gelatinilytica TaxID=2683194 RepID=UPI00193B201D|nr:SprT family zinc-dependent metalloprotease [Anaeromonas gelatinilytica]MBS4536475.1 M48 family metallopeptidase [Anaeromonas gelatinilytica]
MLIHDDKAKKPVAQFYKDRFYIITNTIEQDKLKKSMEKWYRKKTLEKVIKRVEYFQKHFNVKPNSIKVKEQKKIWASCTSKRNMNFNWRCSIAPESVLDYIVVHEMCHMIHVDHSSRFWKLVEKIIPDYKVQREWLKEYGINLNL